MTNASPGGARPVSEAVTPVVAVIPARGGSKRIPRKNLANVYGIPLIGWTIRAALSSSSVGPSNVYISTDDREIADVAESFGARVIDRRPDLGDDGVWTEPVIQDAIEQLERGGQIIDLVLWINACVPELTGADIDMAVDQLRTRNLREVIAVDQYGISHSAVRVAQRQVLFQRRLSVHFGVLSLPYIDVNTPEDLARVTKRLAERSAE